MISDADRPRFDALAQIIGDCSKRGEKPKDEWLTEFTRMSSLRPDWLQPPSIIVPPPPLPPPPPPTAPPRAALPLNPGKRVPIKVDENMERVVKDVLTVWAARYCVFQSGGKLVEIQTDDSKEIKFLACEPNMPRLVPIGASRARALASRECVFTQDKTTRDGTPESKEILPPDWLGISVTTRLKFEDIPYLAALALSPTLRRDGQLIWERGYDASTGIFLADSIAVNVPEYPTQTDARVAMSRLLDLVSDFDFVNDAARSVWVAGVLSIVARHTFNGPVPIIIIDASIKGAGKSKLADLASVIASGTKASRMFYTDDDTEMDKRITALALAGEQTVLIDNVVGKLASPPLDAALTSDSYKGRVLGKTEMTAAVPMKIVWFATGNGLVIGADTARRTVIARLEPGTDHPEDRTGPRPGTTWKYPDIIGYAQEHRAEFLSYALTIVKAYIMAGRPTVNVKPMGSFEAWSNTIRAAIVYSGAADPCETVAQARAADLQASALRMMVECWPVADDVMVTAVSLIEWANMEPPLGDMTARAMFDKQRPIREQWRNALLEWLPAKRGDLPTARDLGYALRAIKGSVIGDFRVDAGESTKSGVPWQRVRIGGVASPTINPGIPAPPSMSLVR
jgi:hypothetical protein